MQNSKRLCAIDCNRRKEKKKHSVSLLHGFLYQFRCVVLSQVILVNCPANFFIYCTDHRLTEFLQTEFFFMFFWFWCIWLMRVVDSPKTSRIVAYDRADSSDLTNLLKQRTMAHIPFRLSGNWSSLMQCRNWAVSLLLNWRHRLSNVLDSKWTVSEKMFSRRIV